MSNEEIKTLIEQEAEKYADESRTGKTLRGWCIDDFKAGATFYEQSILPEVLKDYEDVLADHRRLVREIDVMLNGEKGAAKQASLCDLIGQLSQLQSKMEEEKRKAFEAGKEEAAMWLTDSDGLYPEHHIFEATIEKTGEKVWQYFYRDDAGNNQHSNYFPNKESALGEFVRKYLKTFTHLKSPTPSTESGNLKQ